MKVEGKTIILDQGEEVTVKVNETATEPSVEQPEQPKELGTLKYKFGAISDVHFNIEDTKNSAYQKDLENACKYFIGEGVSHIISCGDHCEYNYEDFENFSKTYTDYAFAPTGGKMRLFAVMGNHDYLMTYHPFDFDTEKYASREMVWQTNISPFHEPESKIHFFEYGAKWNDPQYTGNRTIKSKLNYWFEEHGDIFVCISVDYGASTSQPWDDVSRGWNLLDYNDQYVKRMATYVSDTNYNRTRESAFDYQFYNAEVLCWLWDILEANRGKRVWVFGHHPLPHKAGDSDGQYSRLRIWPHPETDAERNKYYAGSNTLCGLTFWFIDKLNNDYDNAIFVSGHTHRKITDGVTVCNHDYPIIKPTGNEVMPLVDNLESLKDTPYDYRLYTRASQTPCGNAGWTVGLPSLSKPVDGSSKSLYGASEGALFEVYDNGVILRCIVFKRQGDSGYCNEVIMSYNL